jgi:molybdate transport system permease protein
MKAGKTKSFSPKQFNWLRFSCVAILLFFILIIVVLLGVDMLYLATHDVTWSDFSELLRDKEVISALKLSVGTSLITLVLVILVAVPSGYALSRCRFPVPALFNTLVDIPLILPPVVLGLSLLAIFGTPAGMWIRRTLQSYDIELVSAVGIVMGQFLVSVSYCVRAAKASFDEVDSRLEDVSLTLGCTPFQCFRRVTLPLARNGLIAGCVMAWARAIGVFGPLMVFVGTSARVQVMPTAMWLELSIGNIEKAFVIALIMVVIAGSALVLVHWLVPGRKWS